LAVERVAPKVGKGLFVVIEMILRSQVKTIAETFMSIRFRDQMEAKNFLMRPEKWNIWLDLMRDRVNQIDTTFYKSKIYLSKAQVERFIQHGVLAYAAYQLKELKGKK